MGHFSFLPAGETFVVVEARVFSTTFEHFINIFPDSRTDTGMIPVKLWPVVMKDALELLASDELHTATRQGRYYLICLLKNDTFNRQHLENQSQSGNVIQWQLRNV
jgi:hypothetical protein